VRGELQPGDPARIGPYRLVEVLGGGGMGRVYLGRSAGGRPVAVKVIRPELAGDGEFRVRFRREVAAARRVNGFYTAVVVDADADGPVPWLATAHVDAPSLAEAVRDGGPLAASELRGLAAGLAEGLAAIHDVGLVHRDLKPSNVLLAADGPRIIDFGIAWSTGAPSLTGAGLVVGSPGFMSPEQARPGGEVGPATDVFSLGALLCYAATGRGPWGAGDVTTLVYRVVHEEPDLAGVPAEIRDLVARCLAKDPALRPAAAEILAELGDQHSQPRLVPGSPAGSRTPTASQSPAAAPGARGPAPVAPTQSAGPALDPAGDRTVTVNARARFDLFAGEQPRSPVVAGEVPQAPSAFQPRGDLMAELRAAGSGVSVVRAVTGMRGVGKTQLVAAYARQCRDAGWRLVAWVNAEDAPGMLSGLAVIADRLGIDRSGKTLEVLGGEVRNRLEADGDRCLIVFDNVTDFDVVRPYVPALGAPQAVLTTTEATVAGSHRPVQVDVFSEDEALAFLTERTGRDDPEGARALAEELGYLPLALAEAAAVIAAQRLTYPRYLARLRAHPAQQYLRAAKGDPYPRGVAEAILLSVDAVTASDPTGLSRNLLDIVSLLSAEGVSRQTLYLGGSAGVWIASEEAIDEALARLANASLLTFSGDDSVIAHRIVMRVIREHAAHDQTLAALAEKAKALLTACTRSIGDHKQHRIAARECARQITALAGHLAALSANADSGTLLDLRLWVLTCVNDLGDDLAQAIELGESLAADTSRTLGAAHPDTLTAQHQLGSAYMVAGRLDDAISLQEGVLADRRRVLGESHPDTMSARNNLARTYSRIGRMEDAVPLFEAALADRVRLLGASHPDTLVSRHNLGALYLITGRAAEAVPLFEAVLADRERLLGASHPDTLYSRLGLASAYRDAGRVDEAVSLFEALLADNERVLGESHPTTLLSRTNLASAYMAAGRADDGLPLYAVVLADRERVLGALHPDTVDSRYNLACAYRNVGRVDEALPLFEQAVAESERVFGIDHPSTAEVREDLARARQLAAD
jgi:tetratricopeptide (TPR) repeat protein